jgi:hypothetical protein
VSTNNSRWRAALAVVLAAGGVAVIVWFLRTTSANDVREAAHRLAGWLPLVFALEGARIAAEAMGTRALYGLSRDRLPTGALLRAHVIGYSLAFYMPAGRTTAEAVKATMLARWATPARAAAVAAANQSLALLGLAIAALACLAGAALLPGTERLIGALATIAAVTGGLAIAIRIAALYARGRWLQRFAPKLGSLLDEVRLEIPRLVPPVPLAMFVVSRALQLVSIAVLLLALGADVSIATVLATGGINLVGATLGDMVPGQLGATDATFTMSASVVGLTAASGLSMALAIHVVQMTWMALGLVLELAIRIAARQGSRVR